MASRSICLLLLLFVGCNTPSSDIGNTTLKSSIPQVKSRTVLDINQAHQLAKLPLHCMNVEYPNRLNQTLGGNQDLQSPKNLHPAFYGCFDWHSSVHGHWSLVSLLRQFPMMDGANTMKERLLRNITSENIAKEVAYFDTKHNKTYERTYGWAWLLKLAEELHKWDDPVAQELASNLQPLTDLIVEKYITFLPKLNYPIRVGEHTNTAFGLSFAWDYANTLQHLKLKALIEHRAKEFYLKDEDCPFSWEPSGFDFLSPCLEEAALMKRVLSTEIFSVWIGNFLPELSDIAYHLEPGKVTDRNDGKLVHLDGVNFSRAWSLYKIADRMPRYSHLQDIADKHIDHSLPSIVGDDYEGGHWLGSFAIFALTSVNQE